jgi:hypothetical protein
MLNAARFIEAVGVLILGAGVLAYAACWLLEQYANWRQ